MRAAEQQHRLDVANAESVLKALPAISADQDIVAAAFATVLPWVPEAWVSRIVVLLWVGLFTCAPCVLLRLGLVLITADTHHNAITSRMTSQS